MRPDAPPRGRRAVTPGDVEAEAAELRARPAFPAALAAYADAVASFAAGAAGPLKSFHRMARYRIWLALICNHHSWLEGVGPKPTLALLQGQGVCSPRQAATVVAALKAGCYLRAAPDPDDARAALLAPVPAMVLAFSRTTQCYLDLSDAALGRAPAWEADAERLGRIIAAAVREAPSYEAMFARFPLVFGYSCQDCGFLLLCAVMCEALGHAAPAGASPLGLDTLARRLGVSRAHTGAMLAAARAAGHFATARGRLASPPAPALMAEFAEFVSINAVTFRRIYERPCPA